MLEYAVTTPMRPTDLEALVAAMKKEWEAEGFGMYEGVVTFHETGQEALIVRWMKEKP